MRAPEETLKDHTQTPDGGAGLEVWVRCGCALVVAGVAAYASYVHQRAFALQGGADGTSATLWPLSVDGLLLLATVGVLKPARHASRRARWVVWLAFLLGIAVSLAANIAAAPALAWKPVLVAGWPPVALLLSVELLTHHSVDRDPVETTPSTSSTGLGKDQRDMSATKPDKTGEERGEGYEDESVITRAHPSDESRSREGTTAEQVMWEHFQRQQGNGRTPTGAELDRVAGTNNYGRAVLARWRRAGRATAALEQAHPNGTPGDRGRR